MLAKILSSVRFLARQGLALGGDGSDADSNLIQLLKLKGQDNPEMLKWVTRQQNKHTDHRNQNEMLEIMAQMVVHSSPFVAIMVDETTDKSNQAQLTLILR